MNVKELNLNPKQSQVFEGNYLTAMSELREAGFTPWSTEDIMDARNEVPVEHPRWNNYIDTDFGIAATKKKIYLVPHSARLRAATPNTKLTQYGLLMKGAHLDEAKTYSRSDLILDRDLTEKEARASPMWLDFAAGSQELLDTYVENTFRFGKDKFNYDTMMGIFVPADEKSIERAVVLYSLNLRSPAYCNYHLYISTSFVGVRGGAP